MTQIYLLLFYFTIILLVAISVTWGFFTFGFPKYKKKSQIEQVLFKEKVDLNRIFIPQAIILFIILVVARRIDVLKKINDILKIEIILFYAIISAIVVVLLFCIIIQYMIGLYKIISYQYFITSNEIIKRINLFSLSRDLSFKYDNISSISLVENPIDKIFNTTTITFYPIETSRPIKFINISKKSSLFAKVKELLEINSEQVLLKINSNYNFIDFVKGYFGKRKVSGVEFFLFIFSVAMFITISTLLLMLGTVIKSFLVLKIVVIFFLLTIAYRLISYKNSNLKFCNKYCLFENGIFFKTYFYIINRNITAIIFKKFYGTNLGLIKFSTNGSYLEALGLGYGFGSGPLFPFEGFDFFDTVLVWREIDYVKNFEENEKKIKLMFPTKTKVI